MNGRPEPNHRPLSLAGRPPDPTAPRVSIVVPAFNRDHLLGATLDSVLAQTLTDWELVVFDDGSTDSTADVAARYARSDPRITVATGPNGGVASARNRGVALTNEKTPFVAFLDSDDLWEHDTLQTLVDALEADPMLVAVHSVARCIDSGGHLVDGDDLPDRMRARRGYRNGRVIDRSSDEPTTFAELVYHNWVLSPGTQLLRRDAFQRCAPFDLDTDPADDWDMAIRMSRHGDIGFVDRPLLNWRRHDDTLTGTSPRWRSAHFRVLDKTLTDPTNTPAQTASARRTYLGVCGSRVHAARLHAASGRASEASRDLTGAAHHVVRYFAAEIRRITLRVRAIAHRSCDRSATHG